MHTTWRKTTRMWVAGLFALGAAGCIVDGDTCGKNQKPVDGDFYACICEDDAVPEEDGSGCVRCGDHEVVQDDACVCEEGYSRNSPDDDCTKSEAGVSCDDDDGCGDPFPYCTHVDGDDAGYCTADDCSDNDDCEPGYTCEEEDGTRYCRKPPTGLGEACESDDDCADYEASTCNRLSGNVCIVGSCADGSSSCRNEWVCCDYSALVGMPLSSCLSPDQLQDGDCPSGGQQVDP